MSDLKSRIAALIAAQGPLSIAQYMTMALHDPTAGYYATRDPLGRDFITAPEVSQMFGELIGLWLAQCWRDCGAPSPARLVELGPGRGTLMADALRAAKSVPGFLDAVEIVLVEASPVLRKIQYENLFKIVRVSPPHPALSPVGGEGNPSTSLSPSGGEGSGRKIPGRAFSDPNGEGVRWLDHFDSDALSDRPLFLVANEFFDALPIRQYVKTPRGWCERMVTEKNGALEFALAPVPTLGLGDAEDGAMYETSPASIALVEEIAHTIAARGGAALIVDYGHAGGFGDTLQAVAGNKYAPLLDAPGEADLSAHVDFASLVAAARRGGASAFGPVGQGAFLTSLGIARRAEKLGGAEIQSQMERLISAGQMGTLFKALAIVPSAKPPGF